MASAKGGSVPSGLGAWESVCMVWGRAPAESGLWRILKATERSFLYLYDKIWGGGTICISVPLLQILGDLSPSSRDLRRLHRMFSLVNKDYQNWTVVTLSLGVIIPPTPAAGGERHSVFRSHSSVWPSVVCPSINSYFASKLCHYNSSSSYSPEGAGGRTYFDRVACRLTCWNRVLWQCLRRKQETEYNATSIKLCHTVVHSTTPPCCQSSLRPLTHAPETGSRCRCTLHDF